MKKIYVLDTNVFLTNSKSIFEYGYNDVVIPLKVLDEIDKHKKRQASFVPITNSYSESDPPLVAPEELENMFARFRYQPSPPNTPPEEKNIFDKFRYRPTTPWLLNKTILRILNVVLHGRY